MRIKKNLLKESKQIAPNNWDKISSELGLQSNPSRKFVFKPIYIALSIIIITLSSLTVYAFENENISNIINKIFYSETTNVTGINIQKTSSADGIIINTKSVLIENGYILLFYTINDTNNIINPSIDKTYHFSRTSLSINGEITSEKSTSGEIKKDSVNYISYTFPNDKYKNKKVNLEFSFEGIQTNDFSAETILPLNIKNYIINKDLGIIIEKVEIGKKEAKIYVKEPKTHHQEAPYIKRKNEDMLMRISNSPLESIDDKYNRYYTTIDDKVIDNIDFTKPNDYELVVPKDVIYNFKKPIKIKVNTQIQETPYKLVNIKQKYLIRNTEIKSIKIYQMSITVEFKDEPTEYNMLQPQVFFQNMHNSLFSINDNYYNKQLSILCGSTIDSSKSPYLRIDDVEIPLFEN